uniref:Secreted protein n=1 Tax=Loa loa TaxID=7209 RepID=A0A1I7VQF2_LOALO
MIKLAIIFAYLTVASLCAPKPEIIMNVTGIDHSVTVHTVPGDNSIKGFNSTMFLEQKKNILRKIFFIKEKSGKGFFITNILKHSPNISH